MKAPRLIAKGLGVLVLAAFPVFFIGIAVWYQLLGHH